MKESSLRPQRRGIDKNSVRRCLHYFALLLVILYSCILWNAPDAEGVELGTISVNIKDDTILVGTYLRLDEAQIEDLQNGIEKEITFYVDLFRQWSVWPDEFIFGTRIDRKIRSDPVKNEFSVNSTGGAINDEQRFNSLASLLSEALTLKDVGLSPVSHLRPGKYFVKVSAESRIRKLAPVVGYLLFFVPEKEFDVEKVSDIFMIPEK